MQRGLGHAAFFSKNISPTPACTGVGDTVLPRLSVARGQVTEILLTAVQVTEIRLRNAQAVIRLPMVLDNRILQILQADRRAVLYMVESAV